MGRSLLPPFARKLAVLALAAASVTTLAAGTFDGHQSTFIVGGPVARMQLHLFYVTLAVTAFIFVTVGGVLAYAQIKFRARPGDEDKAPPEQTHGHPLIEIGLIVGSVVLLVIIAIPTVKGIAYMDDIPKDALTVRVTGYQWWFKFEYPELGVTTGNELVIPTNRPIHFELRTMDVIHSFWVPKLGGKVDLVPNRNNKMWLQADTEDYLWAQCAEFCGEDHANMRFRVIALNEPEFSAWVAHQTTDARTVDAKVSAIEANTPHVQLASATTETDEGVSHAENPLAYWREKQVEPAPGAENAQLIAQGRDLFGAKTCGGCHTIRGHTASNGAGFIGVRGPDLTHFASRTTIAAAMLDNTPENLHKWLTDPNAVKPGNIMWRDGLIGKDIVLSEGEKAALVAYLDSLK